MDYDLEDRLIDFAVLAAGLIESLPRTRIGNHIAGQMVRCSTSPAPNYGEAQAAESRRDFIHKLRVCLKELRETNVWLKFITKLRICEPTLLEQLIDECGQLIAIFVSSIRTAKANTGA